MMSPQEIVSVLRRKSREVKLSAVALGAAGICGLVGSALMQTSHAESNGTWTWQMSNIHGGGTAQVIATDPVNAGYATVGGDSWGVYNTKTAGNDWLPAMKGLGVDGQNDIADGDFFFMGLSYSHKVPGRVYALTGKLGNTGAGGFGYSEGDSYTVVNRSVSGAEGTGACGDRTVRPRCTGNRLLVDYDAVNDVEYIYAAEGNGDGVARSTDGGVTWTTIGLQGISGITGMAIDPADHSVLYAGTRANGAYKVTGIQADAPQASALTVAPIRVEEMAAIGSNVYAAADMSGVYKLSSGGSVWTKLGTTFFDATTEWASVGGAGDTVYVSGASLSAGHSVARSTDGGVTWAWVPSDASKVGITPWGTTDPWWLAQASPRTKLGCFDGGCTYESTSIAVDQLNPNIVYSAGRSGVWKSEDGGDTWRPAVNHLAGTMHNNVTVGVGGQVYTDDVDWTNEFSDDYFKTVTQGNPIDYGAQSLVVTKGEHTYEVKLSVPRDITLDGQSIADEYFRSAAIRPRDIDVSTDGGTIYVALYGGGVLVGHYTPPEEPVAPPAPPPPPPPVDNPPTVSLSAVPNPASGSVVLKADSSDDNSTPVVTFSAKPHGSTVWTQVGAPVAAVPYMTAWNTVGLTNLSLYDVSAIATDSKGQSSTALVTVTVDNLDHTAPVVKLNSPVNGAIWKQGTMVGIAANASDNVGVVRVKFYVDSNLLATDTTAPYSYSYKVSNLSNGTHSVTAKAFDVAGNVATSPAVSITKRK